MSAPGGCLLRGGSALGGGVGGIPACAEADPPCGRTDSCKNITFATSLRTVITKGHSLYLAGCAHDLNGGRDEDKQPWEFFGSSVTEEVDSDVEENGAGCDIFDDVPSDSDDTYEADDVMFDFTEKSPPSTINLCIDKDKG